MTKEFDAIAYVDHMAGQALTGLIPNAQGDVASIARDAYALAYAMLAEKERRANPPVENP